MRVLSPLSLAMVVPPGDSLRHVPIAAFETTRPRRAVPCLGPADPTVGHRRANGIRDCGWGGRLLFWRRIEPGSIGSGWQRRTHEGRWSARRLEAGPDLPPGPRGLTPDPDRRLR